MQDLQEWSLTAGAVLPSVSHTAVGAGYSCIATGSVGTSVACTALCERNRREITPRSLEDRLFVAPRPQTALCCDGASQLFELISATICQHLCVLRLQFCRLCMLQTGWARDQHANHGELCLGSLSTHLAICSLVGC